MVDIFSREKRSEIMSRIRGKNTAAELIVFKHLREKGLYFQRHYKKAPGSPDIALPRKKRAVFIDGDFWHGRDLESAKNRLVSQYWKDKIQYNFDRDSNNNQFLIEAGWSVLRVWESDIKRKKTRDAVLNTIERFLYE